MSWKVHYKARGVAHSVECSDEADALVQARDIATFEGVTNVRAETVESDGAVRGVNVNAHGEVSMHYAHTAEEVAKVAQLIRDLRGNVYSKNPVEDARLLVIRDTQGDRVRLIARARVGNSDLPLHPVELLWLREGFRRDQMIPNLTPQEYDALIRLLTSFVTEKDVERLRAEWEAKQS